MQCESAEASEVVRREPNVLIINYVLIFKQYSVTQLISPILPDKANCINYKISINTKQCSVLRT